MAYTTMIDYLILLGPLAVMAYLYAFWIAYIVVMGLYRAHLRGGLKGIPLVLAAPMLVLGVVMDVFAQYTVATVIFMDLPARGEYLVTSRLGRYIRHNYGWRSTAANWVCSRLLDVFDPSGAHC